MKRNKYNKEFLETIKAVDTDERTIAGPQYIEMYCHNGCGSVGSKKMDDLRKTLKLYGFAFKCGPCRKVDMYAGRGSSSFSAAVSAGKKGKPHSEKAKLAKRARKNLGDVRNYWIFPDNVDLMAINGHDLIYSVCKTCNNGEIKQLKKLIEAQSHLSHGCGHCWDAYIKTEEYALMMGSRSTEAGSEPRMRQSDSLRAFWDNASEEHMSNWSQQSLDMWAAMDPVARRAKIQNWREGWEAWNKSLPPNYYSENNHWFTKPHLESLASRQRISDYQNSRWENSTADERRETHSRLAEGKIKAAREGRGKTTKVQKQICDWVNNVLKLEARQLWVKNEAGRLRECDVYIESKKIGIEYNGMPYHSEKYVANNYHYLKSKMFRDMYDIRIIHVFDHVWHFNKKQVKSYLRSVLGMNKNVVGTRECEFKVIDKKIADDFCIEYHMQGKTNKNDYNIGLYYKNELVAVACFGAHHRNVLRNALKRFVCKTDWTVNGALSKFSKAAGAHYNTDIISWCDLAMSDGLGYYASGWEIEEVLPPDYFYDAGGHKVIKKQQRRKSAVKTPEGMTEREHALADNLYRVYDCGKLRLVFRKPIP